MKLPKGFQFAGISCGIKESQKKDLSLIVSDSPATAAGVYTQNQVVAAPVLLCRERTPRADAKAVVINSGNANACTGSQGMADAVQMCQSLAELCHVSAEQTLVMSTGVIGHALPMSNISDGLPAAFAELASTDAAFNDAAEGILTTDIAKKVGSRTFSIQGKNVHIAGMAKGAGMIGPNMATMLACFMTDVAISPDECQRLLHASVERSFNCISVEGHTSTNDTVLLLANGQAGNGSLSSEDLEVFEAQLTELAIELAKLIPTDGEGASHLIEVNITGAEDDAAANEIARVVSASNLVKTAVYGNDPNWGRIVSAAGYAKAKVEVAETSLSLNGICLFANGEPVSYDEREASAAMRDSKTVVIDLAVGAGPGSSTHWSSDLTVEYVRFNSEYTT